VIRSARCRRGIPNERSGFLEEFLAAEIPPCLFARLDEVFPELDFISVAPLSGNVNGALVVVFVDAGFHVAVFCP
jgi:hypothetical protein